MEGSIPRPQIERPQLSVLGALTSSPDPLNSVERMFQFRDARC